MIKQSISLLVAAILILTGVMPVYAASSSATSVKVQVAREKTVSDTQLNKETKISKDNAVQIAKEALKEYFNYEIKDKNYESRIELREDYTNTGGYVWAIDWYNYNGGTNESIDVWIDSDTGIIKRLSKRKYDNENNGPTIANYTLQEAKAIADSFIQKINPEAFKEAEYSEDDNPYRIYSSDYYLNYNRKKNGIPYRGNNISVEVDGITGEVIGYQLMWDNINNIPDKEGIIDKEKALEVLISNTEMNLRYALKRNDDEKITSDNVKLVYTPDFTEGSMIDAKTGKPVNNIVLNTESKKTKSLSQKDILKIANSTKATQTPTKEIDQNKANEIIKKYIEDLLGEEFTIESLRYSQEDYYDEEVINIWEAQVVNNNAINRGFNGGNIEINALTGKIVSLYRHDNLYETVETDYQPELTWEEGYDKAIKIIKNLCPEKITELETELTYTSYTHHYNGVKMPEVEYNYYFRRKINGIDFMENSISITLDSNKGEVRRFRMNWNDKINFPEIINIITDKQAKEIFYNNNQLQLMYTKVNENEDYNNPQWEVKLVYTFPQDVYRKNNVNAFTGKIIDLYSMESEENSDFKDIIKGHEYEKQLSILLTQGIIDPEKFDFDNAISKFEAYTMLVKAKGYESYMTERGEDLKFTDVSQESEYYKYLKQAVIYGMIDNKEEKFNGDQNITREELAQIVVKMLGYDKLAQAQEIFATLYKDEDKISEGKKGYIAICNGLNIMDGQDGKFYPTENIDMLDMAIVIYNTFGKN